MTVAVTIGSYRMPEFVILNALQTLSLFDNEVPVLVSDDFSDATHKAREIAESTALAFIGSDKRRGHFAGWWQAITNSLSFAVQEKCDIAVYLSQRFVPLTHHFLEFVTSPFADSQINIVVPSRSTAGAFKLPASKWFGGLGVLCDVLAIRVGSITPDALLRSYTDSYKFGRFSADLLREVSIGRLLATHFKQSAYLSSDLGNPKATDFLRRSQPDSKTYRELAATHGLEGEFDVREFPAIEGRSYKARPDLP